MVVNSFHCSTAICLWQIAERVSYAKSVTYDLSLEIIYNRYIQLFVQYTLERCIFFCGSLEYLGSHIRAIVITASVVKLLLTTTSARETFL